MKDNAQGETFGEQESDTWKVVKDALRGLRFGTVKLIVQDGMIVRVERTENRLLPKITIQA
jgi:hypothetical protein